MQLESSCSWTAHGGPGPTAGCVLSRGGLGARPAESRSVTTHGPHGLPKERAQVVFLPDHTPPELSQ